MAAAWLLSLLLTWISPALQTPQSAAAAATARIAGRVTDAVTGKAVPDATIRLVRWDGGRGTQAAGRADPEGRFEFKNLLPGSYQLTVAAERYIGIDFGQRLPSDPPHRIDLADGQQFDKADVALQRTGAIDGRLVDEFGDGVPGVTVQIARVQFTAGKRRLLPVSGGAIAVRPSDDLGRFRVFNLPPGDYYVMALSGPFAGADDPSGFAPTFYPGTRVATDAQPVHLDAGQEITAISFPLVPAPMATISGTIVDSNGQATAGATLVLLPVTGGDVRSMTMARMPNEPNGTFTFRNVAPGSYVIQAFGRPQAGGALSRSPFGARQIELTDAGMSNVVISVGNTTARGHISFEGAAAPPNPSVVSVSPMPVEFVTSPIMGGGLPPTTIHDDWTFEVGNMSGRRVVRVNIGSTGWVLKRVTLGGKDITDEPVDFSTHDVDGLEITLTSNVSVVTGSVTDNGAPATGFGVLVFAEDSSKWMFPTRFVAVGTANQQGVFRVSGLPAGTYRAVALPSAELAEGQDPAFLEKLLPFSTGLVLGEGQAATLSLKLVRR